MARSVLTLTGRRFRLERATLALGVADGKRSAVTIPVGAVIKVVSDPTGTGNPMVDVHWEGQTLTMFEVDVNVRSTEIEDKSASAEFVHRFPAPPLYLLPVPRTRAVRAASFLLVEMRAACPPMTLT